MSPGYTRCMASSNLVLNIGQLHKVCILSGPLICNDLEDNHNQDTRMAHTCFGPQFSWFLQGKVHILFHLSKKSHKYHTLCTKLIRSYLRMYPEDISYMKMIHSYLRMSQESKVCTLIGLQPNMSPQDNSCKLMLLLVMTTPLDKAGNTRFQNQLHTSLESSLCKTVRPY